MVVFHTFSPAYACFSVLAGIIPLSLRNGGGHLILFAPPCLQVGGGATAPSAPGSAAYSISTYTVPKNNKLVKFHSPRLTGNGAYSPTMIRRRLHKITTRESHIFHFAADVTRPLLALRGPLSVLQYCVVLYTDCVQLHLLSKQG